MTDKATVLVTGGAGYIGSHAVLALRDAGYGVVVLDNLSTGRRQGVPADVPLVIGSVGDSGLVADTLKEHGIAAVMHFAGSIVVPESVSKPLLYYRNNTVNSHALVETCVRQGVQNFIFSSTAAVYGDAKDTPIREDSPTQPINPYGTSKLMTEFMLRDTAAAVSDFRYIALRYFNVAGADPQGRTGQSTPNATHLIKVAAQAALGMRPELQLFGEDYPTPDGTCIRDYIHVTDLVAAHVDALGYLLKGGQSRVFNCGYGQGFSVKEVVKAVGEVYGRPVPHRIVGRRPGDPAALVAASDRIRAELGWTPKHDELRFIVETALAWERRLHNEKV
ncbi:MAG TPA: UDP-glucose 4-epimerase GalE [Alphaproteobacteria bacterium]|nr:UDP-glucose 4-epimerase GalE [Alphaproteobacteria bacterium]